jgi:hypothetical protein
LLVGDCSPLEAFGLDELDRGAADFDESGLDEEPLAERDVGRWD